MSEQDYFISFNWRKAKFHLDRPTTIPNYTETFVPSELSCFLPSKRIDDVLLVRNWLHFAALCYRLLGHFVAGECQGVVVEFETVADLGQFQQQWQHPVNA
jgi:hypothetical protein